MKMWSSSFPRLSMGFAYTYTSQTEYQALESAEWAHGSTEDRFAVVAIKHREGGARDADAIHVLRCPTTLIHHQHE